MAQTVILKIFNFGSPKDRDLRFAQTGLSGLGYSLARVMVPLDTTAGTLYVAFGVFNLQR